MSKMLFAFTAMFAATAAQADQCAWNSRNTSQTARAIMANTDMVVQYCAKCGDKTMKAYMLTQDGKNTKDGKDIHFRDRGDKLWEFEINKSSKDQKSTTLDLAYTYILMTNEATNKSILVNVGELSNGCNPQGVDAHMEWDPGKVECMSKDGSCG